MLDSGFFLPRPIVGHIIMCKTNCGVVDVMVSEHFRFTSLPGVICYVLGQDYILVYNLRQRGVDSLIGPLQLGSHHHIFLRKFLYYGL